MMWLVKHVKCVNVNGGMHIILLLLTYKILHGQAPKYLSDLISLRCSSSLRPIRSSSTLQLTLVTEYPFVVSCF